jgi:hypothetical protein
VRTDFNALQLGLHCGKCSAGVGFRWYCRTFFIQVKNL